MTERGIREPELLRAKQQRDPARSPLLTDEARTIFQPPERVLQFPVTDRRGSDDKRAICDGLGHRLALLRASQQRRRPDRGTRLAKASVVWVDHSQMGKSKVAHGARSRANVERIARSYQDHA